jgi:hypothetical protein
MAWAVLLSILVLVLAGTAAAVVTPRLLGSRRHPDGDMAQEREEEVPARREPAFSRGNACYEAVRRLRKGSP